MTQPPAQTHQLATSFEEREHARFVQQLFQRHRSSLLQYLSGLLGARADAEDVLQDAYARLLAVPNLDRTPSRARAYLFRTATNLAYDQFRRGALRFVAPSGDDGEVSIPSSETPEGILHLEQGVETIRRELRRLKPRCRQVFLLRVTEELGYDAIADRLGISKRTVEREMSHALEVLQRRLRRSRK